MATLKGSTIASTYDLLLKRHETYVQGGTNIELMTDTSGATAPTGLYLESGATTDNVGIGVSDPDELLELYKVGTQLKLSGGAADYATFAVAADGALTITTVDVDAAEADIILAPDGNVGIGTAAPDGKLHVVGAYGEMVVDSYGMYRTDGASDTAAFQINNVGYQGGADNFRDFWVKNGKGTTILAVDGSAGNVGIGTTSPSTNLHLSSASAGLPALLIENTRNDANGGELQLYNNRGAGNASDDDQAGQITFYALDDADNKELYGWIRGVAADVSSGTEDGAISFTNKVAGSYVEDVLRIDGANVGIGTSAPDELLHLTSATSLKPILKIENTNANQYGGAINFVKTSGSPADDDRLGYLNWYGLNDADENIPFVQIIARSDDVSDGTEDGKLQIYQQVGGTGTQVMTIQSGDVIVEAGDIVFGTAGKGICLGVTSNTDANTLDDYEEGTWTGTIKDGSDNAMSMNVSGGYYTKVGNLVHVSGFFRCSAIDSASGQIYLTGLPFTVYNADSARSGATAAYGESLNLAAAGQSVACFAYKNSTNIVLSVWDGTAGTTDMQASEWTDGGGIMIGLSYRAA